MKRKNSSIFSTLIISLLLFTLLLIISLAISIFLGIFFDKNYEDVTSNPYTAINNSDSPLYSIGGWCETLDEDLIVTNVDGEKTDDTWQYTMPELLDLSHASEGEHKIFVQKTDTGYKLFKIPREIIEINYTRNPISDRVILGFKANVYFVVIFVALYILNCILLSIFLNRKISRPMETLKKRILSVNTEGEAVVVSPKVPLEFAEIHTAFDDMVIKLNQSEREKQEMEESRGQLLLNLSHDIKTPISTITIYSKALRDGIVSGQKAQDYLNTIDAKANHVSKLLDDMFTLLKMENKEYTSTVSVFDASELIREVCVEYYDDAQIAKQVLHLDIPEKDVLVVADKTMLHRAVANLLSNAIKYNFTGNNIFVSISPLEDTHFTICVEDDGEPIPEETVKTLFDAFSRGDAARTTSAGSGLGLSITKLILEKHNGQITYCYENGRNRFVMRI